MMNIINSLANKKAPSVKVKIQDCLETMIK